MAGGESSQGHQKGAGIDVGQKVQVYTPRGETLEDYPPFLLDAQPQFDLEGPESVHACEVEDWLEEAQACSWQVSHLGDIRSGFPSTTFCAGVLEARDRFPPTEDPKCAADLCEQPLRTRNAQTAVKILDQESSEWMNRIEDVGMNCSMF